jgi:hypothetical protein
VNGEFPIDDLRADLDAAPFGLRFEAMLDRVFDERLQHHRREYRGFQSVRNIEDPLHASLHPHAHDLEERAGKIDLLTERGPPAFAHLRHGRSQVADQAALHL